MTEIHPSKSLKKKNGLQNETSTKSIINLKTLNVPRRKIFFLLLLFILFIGYRMDGEYKKATCKNDPSSQRSYHQSDTNECGKISY